MAAASKTDPATVKIRCCVNIIKWQQSADLSGTDTEDVISPKKQQHVTEFQKTEMSGLNDRRLYVLF